MAGTANRYVLRNKRAAAQLQVRRSDDVRTIAAVVRRIVSRTFDASRKPSAHNGSRTRNKEFDPRAAQLVHELICAEVVSRTPARGADSRSQTIELKCAKGKRRGKKKTERTRLTTNRSAKKAIFAPKLISLPIHVRGIRHHEWRSYICTLHSAGDFAA